MPKVSPEHEQQRRQTILQAAVACFRRRGVHRTSIQEICKEAGLSKGGLYTYFQSKDQLLVALVTENFVRGLEQAMAAGQAGTTTFDKLDRVGKAVVEQLAATDQRAVYSPQLLPEILAAASKNPQLRSVCAESYDRWKTFLTELLREGQAAGQVKADIDPHALAAVLVAVFDGLSMQEGLSKTKVDWPRILGTLRQALGEGVLTPAGVRARRGERTAPAARAG